MKCDHDWQKSFHLPDLEYCSRCGARRFKNDPRELDTIAERQRILNIIEYERAQITIDWAHGKFFGIDEVFIKLIEAIKCGK